MDDSLHGDIARTAFAFRGYNITNLGRSGELLRHPIYGPVVRRHLQEASEVCSQVVGKKVRLVDRVRDGRETTLKTYAEAISIIVSMELAQVALLENFHGVTYADAKLAFGYSLGELAALACGDVIDLAQALEIPLAMSKDCVELAKDCTMGVLFTRDKPLDLADVKRLCLRINREGEGVIGISAILSPNTLLLMGQGKTIAHFKNIMHDSLPQPVHLRPNPHRWPPLHTPIMWQRNIPNRAADMMHIMPGGSTAPKPPVLSLVTGKISYDDHNFRETLHHWVDHPQRLWDAIYGTLAEGVKTVVHVGPEPNLIPATFKRLSDNVVQQVSRRSLSSLGIRAVSRFVERKWLAAILPSRTALLRAPKLRHVILEDWLLEQPLP